MKFISLGIIALLIAVVVGSLTGAGPIETSVNALAASSVLNPTEGGEGGVKLSQNQAVSVANAERSNARVIFLQKQCNIGDRLILCDERFKTELQLAISSGQYNIISVKTVYDSDCTLVAAEIWYHP